MDWRRSTEQLRAKLAASLGLGSALVLGGCGGGVSSDGDDAGVTTDPSGDGSTLDGDDDTGSLTTIGPEPTTTGTTAPDPDPDTDTDTDTDPGPKFDIGAHLDVPLLGDCVVTTTEAAALDAHPECPIVLDDGFCWSDLYLGCVPAEPGLTCEELCPEGDCVTDWTNCHGDTVDEAPSEVCGPYEVEGMCCSLAEIGLLCGSDGRPFVVAGVARLARLRSSVGPASSRIAGTRSRRHLAARWAAIARAEHASIASFASFARRLLALGAPAALVRDALAAAADEARHATLAVELASTHGGDALEFGPLSTHGAAQTEDFADTVLAAVREGCIGETLAALELEVAAGHCTDPELRARLRAVADDELRHATLAWRVLAWALVRDPSLGPRVAALFSELDPEVAASALSEDERAWLRAHACLPDDERQALSREAVREVLVPCARALLAAHTA